MQMLYDADHMNYSVFTSSNLSKKGSMTTGAPLTNNTIDMVFGGVLPLLGDNQNSMPKMKCGTWRNGF